MALMLFHAARSEARVDGNGAIVLLHDQDRGKWDGELIALADRHLHQAAQGTVVSAYHVEAGIASVHAHAPSFGGTDFTTIVELYDRLLTLTPTPVVRFNRAIAIGQAQGAAAGLKALDAVDGLEHSHLYHAARGDLLRNLSRKDDAQAAYSRALMLVRSPLEMDLLERKRRGLDR